jgi:hypothetical protein
MNHSETEIPIIENGWMKLKCTVGDSIALLPSNAILDRLIRFPKTPYHDLYNLEKFRIRPQIFNRESQLLLQERSNQIIFHIRVHPLTVYEQALVRWSQEKGINPEETLFRHSLIFYCESILPEENTNQKKEKKIEDAIKKSITIDRTHWEQCEYDYQNLDWRYFLNSRRQVNSLVNRFHEYRSAKDYFAKFFESVNPNDCRKAYLDEYTQVNLENGRVNRLKEKVSKTGNQVELTSSTQTILTQCLFCYRFHLQTSRSNLSRYCPLEECADTTKHGNRKKYGKNHYWEKSLESLGIKQSDVPLSGF